MSALSAFRAFVFNVYLGQSPRPARRPVDFYIGETGEIIFRLFDAQGTRIDDLTGVTAAYKIARRGYGPGAVASYATGGGGITIEGGEIKVALTITDALAADSYDDQLTVVKDGKTLVASSARFNIRPNIV